MQVTNTNASYSNLSKLYRHRYSILLCSHSQIDCRGISYAWLGQQYVIRSVSASLVRNTIAILLLSPTRGGLQYEHTVSWFVRI